MGSERPIVGCQHGQLAPGLMMVAYREQSLEANALIWPTKLLSPR